VVFFINSRKIPDLKTGVFPISLDYWSSEKRFGFQQVLLAVTSGRNSASDSETGRELWNSQNNGAAFCRISANYPSETGNRSPY